jgi:hypothetical protein
VEVIFKLTIYYKIYVLYTINFIGHNMKKTVLLCLLVATLSACVNGDPKSYQIESLDSVMNNEKFIKNVEKLNEEEQRVVKDYIRESVELKNFMEMAHRSFPPENEKYLLEYPITLEKILSIHTEIYREKEIREDLTLKYGRHSSSSYGQQEDLREQNKELIADLMAKSLEAQTRQNQTDNPRLKDELQKTINLYRELITSASWR